MTRKDRAARNKRAMMEAERELRPGIKSILAIAPLVPIMNNIQTFDPAVFVDFQLFEARMFNILAGNIGNSALIGAQSSAETLPRPARDRLIWSQYGTISATIQAKAEDQTRQISDGTRAAILYVLLSSLNDKQKSVVIRRVMGLSEASARVIVDRYREVYSGALEYGKTEYQADSEAIEQINEQSQKHRDWRAEIIGISAITAGMAMGARDVLESAASRGLITRDSLMYWENAGDGKVRSSHQEVPPAPIGGMFVLGSGVATEGPGLSGVPSEDCQCRCSIVYGGE